GLPMDPTTNPGDPTAPSVFGQYTLDLQILGTTVSSFPPLAGGFDVFDATNITVAGDVLPIAQNGVFFTNLGGGVWKISHLIPTRVNGNVTVTVDWQHLNTTLTIPIIQGADSSVDKTDITVDTTTTLTVTIKTKGNFSV